MPYACGDTCLCQDAFDACIHASLSLLACSFGPLVICVFIWQVFCPRGQVCTIRQDVCTCYCSLTLPDPSCEKQSTHPTLSPATPYLTLLPMLQRKQSARHTLTQGTSNALLPLKGGQECQVGVGRAKGRVCYRSRDQCLQKLVTGTKRLEDALQGQI